MQESRFRQITYSCFRFVVASILKLGFRLKIVYEQQPVLPCLFAGNHSSFLDGPIVMMLSNRRVHFLADENVRNWLIVGAVLDIMGAIFIPKARPKRALLKMIEVANQQKTICIFPEGKLTTTGELNEMNPGVVYISQKTGLPIVPFYIQGAFDAWPWGQKVPRLVSVKVRVGEAIYPDQLPESSTEAIVIVKQAIANLANYGVLDSHD